MATIRNVNEWQLFHLAQALTRAKRLEKLRTAFHEELYMCISYPSVQIDPFIERKSSATDSQAIRIIEAKERYDLMIQNEYKRHVRWQNLLLGLDSHDQEIFIRYFQKKKHIQPKIIGRLLNKIEKHLNKEERRIEQERTTQSAIDFKKYQEQTRSFRKKIAPVNKDKQKIRMLINGRFVYLSEEERKAYQEA